MVEMRVRLEGAEELKQRLRRAPGIVRKHLRRGMDQAVKTVQRKAQVYPPPPPAGYWAALTTRAQKAAFFAQLREGGWSGRSGKLGQRWTASVRASGSMVRGVVENPIWYGPYVMKEGEQATFHHGRWKTLARIVKETTREILGFLEAALEAALREIGG